MTLASSSSETVFSMPCQSLSRMGCCLAILPVSRPLMLTRSIFFRNCWSKKMAVVRVARGNLFFHVCKS